MIGDTTAIILTGAVVGASCALVGSFLVLRRLAMLGDAISHAVLPGIALAFLITGSRSSLPMFLGAAALGGLTAFLVQVLSRRGIQGDAAIGVTFTSLFAVGVVLVSLYGSKVDLDLECVLYGEIAYTPFDQIVLAERPIGPRALWVNAILLVLNALVIGFFYKQFKLCAFDPELAASVGISVAVMHYALMGLVAMTTVGAFESVGAILVVAMLVVPGATAYLLTERLGRMIAIAMALGAVSAVVGYALAHAVDGSIAGAMATASGGFFALAFLFSPRQGIVARFVTRARIRRRVAEEDLLLWAGRRREAAPALAFATAEVPALAGASSPATVLGRLSRLGLVQAAGDVWALTERGLDQARELIRRHRLYESYLGELGYDPDHVHEPADRVEHWIAGEVTAEVEEAARYPDRDPHDRPIPRRPGDEPESGRAEPSEGEPVT